jgi:lambda family phage portal protein
MSTPAALSMSNWQPSELPEPKPKKQRSAVGLGVGSFYAGAALYGGGWLQALRSKDQEIRKDALALRSNSRRLANNNPYMRRYLRALGDHVVGPSGFTLQSSYATRAGARRDPYAGKCETAFSLWGKKGTATVCGNFSWLDVQRLAIRTAAMDGECFIRIVRGYRGNAFGFALQFLDADLLDHTYTVVGGQGQNAVVMGVEIDNYGKPVAYWFTDPVSARASYPRGAKVRIPAADIIHLIDRERSVQTRGVPWSASVMYLISMLGHYWEAEVANARHESERVGFLKSATGALDEVDEDRENAVVPTIDPVAAVRMMPASTSIGYVGLPAGIDIEIPDVKHPTTAFADFSKAMLKGIASGLGVSYAALSSDLTEVSFSSIRTGTLEDREYYRELQGLMIETLCERVYQEFIYMAVLSGQLTMPAGATFEAFSAHTWEPRGWDWVDPKNDTMAKIASIDACLDTRTRILAERGLNFDDVVARLADEKKALDAAGLIPVTPPKNLATADDPNNPADTGDGSAPAKKLKETA